MPTPTPDEHPPSERPTTERATHRIAKLLARAGIASRREIERMIADGRVAKDGVVLDTPATVLASLHGVTVDGEPVEAAAPPRLFLFHKPTGVLTTERDPQGRSTIYDRLPEGLPRLMPVGRLDLNTEGLLLLTTDGELKRQLELPATGVERAYRARAYGQVSQTQLEDLIEGVEIEGVRYGSINANLERRTGANVWIELILTEGKNREVRRVLEHLGLKVSRLIRTRYGPFVLGDLPPGEVGEIRQHDLVAFRKNPKAPPPKLREEAPRPSAFAPRGGKAPVPVAVTPQRPVRGAPRRGVVPVTVPQPREDTRPVRGSRAPQRPAREDSGIAKPARAARAAAHRNTFEPRAGEIADRPPATSRTAGPSGGRGKPRVKPARPPRTRK